MISVDGAGTLDWIEEPIRDESPEAYEELRKLTPVPFAVGEEFASKWQFLPFIVRCLAFCSASAQVDYSHIRGVSCVGEGPDELLPRRHLQRRRLHRVDEGGRLVRGSL